MLAGNPSAFPPDDDPRMICLLREGKEIIAQDAADGRDAVIVACKILLDQPGLKIGDQLVCVRL
jgi:hypothetical protein